MENPPLESIQHYDSCWRDNRRPKPEVFRCEDCGAENDSDDGEELCQKCKRERINEDEQQ